MTSDGHYNVPLKVHYVGLGAFLAEMQYCMEYSINKYDFIGA